MKLAIIGSRSFNNYELMKEYICRYYKLIDEIELVISGGARGADTMAAKLAEEYRIPTLIFLPDYEKFKRGAPIQRNFTIVDAADTVIAFWDGASPGTAHAIRYASKQNKQVYTVIS